MWKESEAYPLVKIDAACHQIDTNLARDSHMRFFITVVLVFIVLVWDIGQNRGELIKTAVAMGRAFLSSIGLG